MSYKTFSLGISFKTLTLTQTWNYKITFLNLEGGLEII